jgi:type I restriction enzyme, S subunit
LSTLPKGWARVSLQETAHWASGGTPSRSNSSFYIGSIPWFKTGELGSKILTKAEEHISEEALALSSAKLFPAGSVAIAMYGATIGKASILGVAAATNQACAVGIPSATSAEFLYYFLISQTKAFVDAGKGGAQPNISQGIVKDWPIDLPPRKEQTRIVAKLEELLSELDAGVAELKAAQKKLTQYRQSLLKAAVEGALTAEWRKSNPPTETGAQLLERILVERLACWEAKQLAKFKEQGKAPPKDWQSKYPVPVKPDLTGLPELPEGWVWASAEQICEFITKGTTPSKNPNVNSENGIPFLRVTNLTDTGEIDLRDKVFVSVETHSGFLARSKVFTDDILMNIVGPPLGQVSHVSASLGECNVNQAIAIFRCIHGALPKYMLNALLSPTLQRWLAVRAKTTAGQTNLTLEVCRSLPVPLSPHSEQNEIVSRLAESLSELKRQGSSLVEMLNNSKAQRANILKSAFSGKLVPQDSNDEPASTLLAKISASRSESLANTQRRKVTKATSPVL